MKITVQLPDHVVRDAAHACNMNAVRLAVEGKASESTIKRYQEAGKLLLDVYDQQFSFKQFHCKWWNRWRCKEMICANGLDWTCMTCGRVPRWDLNKRPSRD